MSMPIDLVLVRHGESEGNRAKKRAKKGDKSAYTPEFLNRHSSLFRLTDRGQQQAVTAGAWLRQEFPDGFDRHMVSEYIRAQETAGLLNLVGGEWDVDFFLREQDYGKLDILPDDEIAARFADEIRHRDRDGFFWTPPNGESMADVCQRAYPIFDRLHRECSDKRAIIVCHGNVMWAWRVRLERIPQERFAQLNESKHDYDRIHNCQVLHYTRRNPVTRKLSHRLEWMRSVCPWDPDLSSNTWTHIVRPRYSNAELLAEAARHPRMVNNRKKP